MHRETFTKERLRDRVTSSAGFTITLRRDAIEYEDVLGRVSIDAEWSPGGGTWIIVYRATIPDLPERPSSKVLEDLTRAFSFAEWHLTVRS